MKLSRRHFFRVMGSAGALVATNSSRAQSGQAQPDVSSVGSLVDITRCIGCRKCEFACNASNKLPHDDFRDLNVLDEKRRPDAEKYTVVNSYHGKDLDEKDHLTHIYVKDQCRHCLKPACASACVVGALTKKKNGPVHYDEKKCIGCRYCMVACPFQIPAYEDHDPLTPRVRKCTFCFERLEEGKMPACVTICPTQALIFGKRDVLLSIAGKRIKNNPGKYTNHIYGEHEVGGTSWMYLSPVDFSFFPKVDNKPAPKLTEMFLSGAFGYAAAPIALLTVLGGVAWINNRKDIVSLNDIPTQKKGGKS